MTDMPEKIAAWRFVPDKADEWIHGGWSEDHDHKTQPYIRADHVDALLKAEREKSLREAADVCTYVIKNYDVMEPGKPDQFASLKTQKAAKGMVSLARQDIEALISEEKTDG